MLCVDKREGVKSMSNEDYDFWFLYILFCLVMGSVIAAVVIGG